MRSTNEPSPVPVDVPTAGDVAPPPDAGGPSIFTNSAANLAGLIAANGMSALSGLITANWLGPAGVGILAVIFGLTEFGRSLSNFTHNPSIIELHRGKSVATVFGTSLALKFVGTALFVASAIVAAPYLAVVFGIPADAFLLASVILLVGSFYEIGSARMEAEDRYVLRNILLALGPAAGLVAVLTFIALDRYTVHTAVISTMIAVATMSTAFLFAWKGPWKLRWDARTASYLTRYGLILVASTFVTQALIWTDTLMLGALRGAEAAGIYNVVFQLTFVMVTGSVAIGVALVPAMARLAGRGESTALAYQRGTLLSLVIAIPVAIVYLVGGPWLLLLYGAEFVDGHVPLVILTLFGIAGALFVPASSALMVHGKASWLTVLGLVQAIVNLGVNYVLINAFGMVGAAIATTSIFIVGTLAAWVMVHRITGAKPLSRHVAREGRDFLKLQLRRLRGRKALP